MNILVEDFSYGLFFMQTIMLLSIILFFYSLIDVLRSSFKDNNKLIWALVVLFVPILGSIFYVVLGRKTRLNKVSF